MAQLQFEISFRNALVFDGPDQSASCVCGFIDDLIAAMPTLPEPQKVSSVSAVSRNQDVKLPPEVRREERPFAAKNSTRLYPERLQGYEQKRLKKAEHSKSLIS
jgi:hypothetical protein